MKKLSLFAGLALVAGLGLAVAQTTNGPLVPNAPTVQAIGPNDVIPDVVGGFPQANSQYATAAQVGVYGSTLFGGNYDNALIGGDFSTNLFQRGTSVSLASSTYYVAYGADRWFSWGGTSTPATMTQQTGSTDLPSGTTASYRINKGSLTGVLQICTSQVLEGTNAVRFQGQTAEFAFDAKAGPTFSAASSNLAVYVSTGTVVDEGATKMAYGLNAQGGAGTTAWTGQVNLGGTGGFLIPITTSWNRYGVAVPIPIGALEIGVSICYTPVGTGTSTDWFEFGKAQLTANPAVTAFAGTSGAAYNVNDNRMKSFARRAIGQETLLQERYFYALVESATSGTQQSAAGNGATTTTCQIYFPFPATMRIAPTFAGVALTTSTFTITHIATATALASTYAAVLGANTTSGGSLTMTVASGRTPGQTCVLTSAAAATPGQLTWSAEL